MTNNFFFQPKKIQKEHLFTKYMNRISRMLKKNFRKNISFRCSKKMRLKYRGKKQRKEEFSKKEKLIKKREGPRRPKKVEVKVSRSVKQRAKTNQKLLLKKAHKKERIN